MRVEKEYYLSGFPETELDPVGRPYIFSVPTFFFGSLVLVEPECAVVQQLEPVGKEEDRVEAELGILVDGSGFSVAVDHNVLLQLVHQEGLLSWCRLLETDNVWKIFPDRLDASGLPAFPIVLSGVRRELDPDVERHHAGFLTLGLRLDSGQRQNSDDSGH